MEICLIHLVWGPAGNEPLTRFLASHAEHQPGVAHRLLFVFNGFANQAQLDDTRRLVAGIEHQELDLGDTVIDLTAYRRAAQRCSGDAVCFVNSYSTILQAGWLAMMATQLERSGVGLVGATGSHESPLSGQRLPLRLLRAGRYPRFPNPHIRTNAFMLSRDLMLDLYWPDVPTKESAWELESGVNGLTRQMQARGLAAVVVGRDGDGYPSERWRESATFRAGGQRNLLVADNRTRQYDEASPRFRRRLERLAWGSVERPRVSRNTLDGGGAATP